MITFSIEIAYRDREEDYIPLGAVKIRQAKTAISQYIRDNEQVLKANGASVYLSWFRTSDGQKGYFNRNGYNLNGDNWLI